jgi:hypothetical protein
MSQPNKIFRFGPIALTTTTTTNLLNTTVTSFAGTVNLTITSIFVILYHLRVVNKTGSPVTVSLWIGATAGNVAGTEFDWSGTSVAAQGTGSQNWLDWYGKVFLQPADFLVGGASVAASLTMSGEGEVGILQ